MKVGAAFILQGLLSSFSPCAGTGSTFHLRSDQLLMYASQLMSLPPMSM